jgi:hypothetical protein
LTIRADRARGAECRLKILAKLARATREAGDVVTDVDDDWRLWRCGEQSIEAGDAIRFSRRDGQAGADIVKRSRADPPDAILNGMQCWQQQMPAIAHHLPANGLPCGALISRTSRPPGFWRTENAVYRGALVVIGGRVSKMKIQVHTTLRVI